MIEVGTVIVNPRTGQRTVFQETGTSTGGALLRMETFHPPHSPAEPEHIHPRQDSRCVLLAGALRFHGGGREQHVRAGEALAIPQGVPHYFWNDSHEPAHAIQEFQPALTIESFFVSYFALARDGKLNRNGLPSLLQLAVLMERHDDDIRVTAPPRLVQLALIRGLAPIGRLLGYRDQYM